MIKYVTSERKHQMPARFALIFHSVLENHVIMKFVLGTCNTLFIL